MKNAQEIQAGERTREHALPSRIDIGKVDGALVDENGFYVSHPETKAEIVRRYNSQPGLLKGLKFLFACFDDNTIVRNTEKDADPDWHNRMAEFVHGLAEADIAIRQAEGRQP